MVASQAFLHALDPLDQRHSDLLKECDGIDGIDERRIGQPVECSEQAANESWWQPTCGYPVPDARPLAADVSTAGHAYQSCTGDEPLSPENHQMGRGHETAHAGHFGHPYNYGGESQPSGFGRGAMRHVAADKDL
jgi:hypothetical protein